MNGLEQEWLHRTRNATTTTTVDVTRLSADTLTRLVKRLRTEDMRNTLLTVYEQRLRLDCEQELKKRGEQV